MPDKKKLIREFILKNPKLSGNQIYGKTKGTPLGIRKTDFYSIFRETKNLPEPTLTKRVKSIPVKHRKARPIKPKITKPPKPPKIPFEQTKFGKMVKTAQTTFNVSEKSAILYTRKILKIPKMDYDKLDQIDQDILTQYGY